ncbi:MAG TPA: outer membrane beta-barrel protein [Candidatus Deferrimicrobium sp.]|nr:outer membrane beta-barrel protein [Candidatus Deferrimicrobium sp.]
MKDNNMLTRNMNLWSSLGIVAILLTGSHAFAGEPGDWKGWYAGAFGGYVSGELNSNDPSHKESTGDYNDDGPMAGVSFGYHRQFSNGWIGGIEIMVPLYMQKGTAVDKQYFPDTVTYEASYRYGLLLAAKWGRGYGKALPYAFGALGFTNVVGKTFNVDLSENYAPGFEQSAAATHFLWQLGAGADYQVSEVVFLGARVAAFIGARADHTMPWNEPGPNEFGYKAVLVQLNGGYRF